MSQKNVSSCFRLPASIPVELVTTDMQISETKATLSVPGVTWRGTQQIAQRHNCIYGHLGRKCLYK